MRESKSKVFLVGLDGSSFEIIEPLVQRGLLPTFARLMAEGAWGELTTAFPPITAVAWTSLVTGKNPGSHGIFDFFAPEPGSYGRIHNTSRSVRSACLWDALGAVGRKVGLMDIPLSYPPSPVNGFMVSGTVPSEESPFTYPSDLKQELMQISGSYPSDRSVVVNFGREGVKETIPLLIQHTKAREEAALRLMEEKEWDFFMVVFRGTDMLHHRVFLSEEQRREYPERARLADRVLPEYYQLIDSILDEIVGRLDDETTLVMASDHGAGPVEKNFYLNEWLIQEGYLCMGRQGVGKNLRSSLGRFRARLQGKGKAARRSGASHTIDWDRTTAYKDRTGPSPSLRINLMGRQPLGTVDPSEIDRLRDEIGERLRSVVDPDTGDPVVEAVYLPDEIYTGPYVNEAPDLLFMPTGMRYRVARRVGMGEVIGRPRRPWGGHRMEGMVLFKGPAISPGERIRGSRIEDVAPTVLHLMGMSVPEDMDGRVLENGIRTEYRETHPVVFAPPIPWKEQKVGAEETLSKEEKRALEESLRGLGYLE